MTFDELCDELEDIAGQLCQPHCRPQWMLELVDHAAETAARWKCGHTQEEEDDYG